MTIQDARSEEALSKIQVALLQLNDAEVSMVKEFLELAKKKSINPSVKEEIHAEVIRSLCILSAEHNTEIVLQQGIRVENKKILGQLNLDSLSISFPIRFNDCEFSEGISLNDAKTRLLDFSNSTCTVFQAERVYVDSNLMLSGFRVSKVSLRCARITGDLSLSGANIGHSETQEAGSVLDLDRADIGGTVFLNYCRERRKRFCAYGETSLKGISVRGNLNCEGAKLCNQDESAKEGPYALNANQAVFHGNVYLRKGRSPDRFMAEGQIIMLEAEIFGALDCEGGYFNNPRGMKHAISFDRSHIKGSVFFSEKNEAKQGFSSNGEVRLIGTRVEGDVHCAKGIFLLPKDSKDTTGFHIDMQRAKIGGTVFLESITTRAVSLNGAEIGADLKCNEAKFVSIEEGGGDKEKIGLYAIGARIGGQIILAEINNDNGNVMKISLKDAHARGISLPWEDRDVTSWAGSVILEINGFTFDFIIGCNDKKSALQWLHLQKNFSQPQPYDQLAAILFLQGHEDLARDILENKEDERTKYPMNEINQSGRFERLRKRCLWVWHRLFKATVGYGYKPKRAIGWALSLLIMGSVIFYAGNRGGLMVSIKDNVYQGGVTGIATKYYDEFNPFFYAVDVLVPGIDLGQRKNWHPTEKESDNWSLWWGFERVVFYYPAVSAIAGWVLIAFVLVGGVLRKSMPTNSK